jgi:hypothetical protein
VSKHREFLRLRVKDFGAVYQLACRIHPTDNQYRSVRQQGSSVPDARVLKNSAKRGNSFSILIANEGGGDRPIRILSPD